MLSAIAKSGLTFFALMALSLSAEAKKQNPAGQGGEATQDHGKPAKEDKHKKYQKMRRQSEAKKRQQRAQEASSKEAQKSQTQGSLGACQSNCNQRYAKGQQRSLCLGQCNRAKQAKAKEDAEFHGWVDKNAQSRSCERRCYEQFPTSAGDIKIDRQQRRCLDKCT